jgi:hypothetical protein
MNCNECNIEFTPTRINVEGQKYCSIKCRNLSAQKRQREKIISNYQKENEVAVSDSIGKNNIDNRENEYSTRPNYNRQPDYNIIENKHFDYKTHIGLVEANFETKSDLILCRIQLDYANKEKEVLKQKIKDLEIEIFTLENEEEEVDPQKELISNLIKGFATDPVGVLNFAKTMFQPKTV